MEGMIDGGGARFIVLLSEVSVVTRVSSVFVMPAGCCSMSRLEAIVSVCYYPQVSLAA
jgi:hypothetical protein